MVVVLQWHFNNRDASHESKQPELVGVFGPFADVESAEAWRSGKPQFDGWGRFEFEIKAVTPPGNSGA